MITRIQTLNYRALRHASVTLSPFQVLVGANATGKTTLLDVVEFLGDLVRDGLEAAIEKRVENFEELLWNRSGDRFELALEVRRPVGETLLRYEVGVQRDLASGRHEIQHERLATLTVQTQHDRVQRSFFPDHVAPPDSILGSKPALARTLLSKAAGGYDTFNPESSEKKWNNAFKFGPYKSALANVPADLELFPAANWLRDFLISGIQKISLDSNLIRQPCPPGRGQVFRPDGSNLPRVISQLQINHPASFEDWVAHVHTALPDIVSVDVIERPEDKRAYIRVHYTGGLKLPSWTVSDGTLRLLALSILPYLPDFSGTYLIEEPENGIHPMAVETLIQSLSGAYDAQVLLATHSPAILRLSRPEDLICFAKDGHGQVDIVRGEDHPRLQYWQSSFDLATLHASGILG